jgi:hypothetical protein
MEAAILSAENEVVRLDKLLAEPDFFVSRAADWPQVEEELKKARKKVAQLYERWEILGMIAQPAGAGAEGKSSALK